ncbi:MAG: ATP-binding cassette domain-containing protein [Lachnospiraceae bacterium]
MDTIILEIKNLYKKYSDIPVIDNLSMTIRSGQRAAISGASGEGKTSLLNIILGLRGYDSGTVLKHEKLHLLTVFQEDRLFPSFDALDNIGIYPYPFVKETALEILKKLELGDVCDKPAAEYSGGMKRRLAIARALYGCTALHAHKPGEPLLLIMDEPFKGLDPTLRKKVIDTVDDIVCRTGSALILVTHESDEAVALGCEQIALKPKRRDVNRWH